MLWPVVMLALLWPVRRAGLAVAIAAAMVVLPPVVVTGERAARAYATGLRQEPVDAPALGRLGGMKIRPEMAQHAIKMERIRKAHRATFDAIAQDHILPDYIYYSGFDSQYLMLKHASEAVEALRRIEDASGLRFETIGNLNFVNPFPWAMGRTGPLHVSIGQDPSRTVPPLDGETAEAVSQADVVLLPTCPLTMANLDLMNRYLEAEPVGLSRHQRRRLTDCYDAFVRPDLVDAFGS